MPEPKLESADQKERELRKSYLLFDEDNKPTKELESLLNALSIQERDLDGINTALQKRFRQQAKERWELEKKQKCPQKRSLFGI